MFSFSIFKCKTKKKHYHNPIETETYQKFILKKCLGHEFSNRFDYLIFFSSERKKEALIKPTIRLLFFCIKDYYHHSTLVICGCFGVVVDESKQ